MLALINGEFLGNATDIGWIVIIPAGVQLFELDGVGTATINLVGAHVDEHGLRGTESGGFQKVQGAGSVRVKIIKRPRGREIMAGLRSGMDDMGGLQCG